MLVIGLTGEIASGKSTFSEYVLEQYGIPTVSLRSAYETPGTSRKMETESSRLERSKILDARVAAIDPGPSKTKAALQVIKQVVGPKIRAEHQSRENELIIVSDITRMVEVQFLRELGFVSRFELVAINPLDLQVRWNRYTQLEGMSLLDRDGFRECDGYESGDRNVESKKDWVADIRTVSLSAKWRLDNSGAEEEFHVEIDAMLADLGVNIETEKSSARSFVRNQMHIPNSIQRVRELQQRHLAARFLEAFYALELPQKAGKRAVAGLMEPDDEVAVFEKMVGALKPLGILESTRLSDKHRSLSSLIGPRHSVREISNQFMYRLVKVFLNESTTEALEAFKKLPFSTSQEEVLVGCLNETEFVKCHQALHEFLGSVRGEIHNYATIAFASSRESCDLILKKREGTQGLKSMLEHGIHVNLIPGSISVIKEAQASATSGPVPVLEMIKNQRIMQLAGQANSKVSHAIHDAIDHVWFFDILDRNGILSKHKTLFDRLGAPQEWDLFQRAGECVASISFGVRLFANQPAGFVPLHSVEEIERDFSDAVIAAGGLLEKDLEPFSKIRDLANNPRSLEAQSLQFVWSNYLVELNEQRRKDGEILEQIDGASWAPLDPRGLDYLSFFLDAHTELHNSKNKHRDNLLRVHLHLEEFLTSEEVLEGSGTILKWSELSSPDANFLKHSTLPERRIDWMAKHYGFTALRDSAI